MKPVQIAITLGIPFAFASFARGLIYYIELLTQPIPGDGTLVFVCFGAIVGLMASVVYAGEQENKRNP